MAIAIQSTHCIVLIGDHQLVNNKRILFIIRRFLDINFHR